MSKLRNAVMHATTIGALSCCGATSQPAVPKELQQTAKMVSFVLDVAAELTKITQFAESNFNSYRQRKEQTIQLIIVLGLKREKTSWHRLEGGRDNEDNYHDVGRHRNVPRTESTGGSAGTAKRDIHLRSVLPLQQGDLLPRGRRRRQVVRAGAQWHGQRRARELVGLARQEHRRGMGTSGIFYRAEPQGRVGCQRRAPGEERLETAREGPRRSVRFQ